EITGNHQMIETLLTGSGKRPLGAPDASLRVDGSQERQVAESNSIAQRAPLDMRLEQVKIRKMGDAHGVTTASRARNSPRLSLGVHDKHGPSPAGFHPPALRAHVRERATLQG